jgi:PAS domain S-box-containing protein
LTTPYRLGTAEAAALAAIVVSSPDAVIAKTIEGIVTAWNDGAAAIYGYTAAEILGRSIELTIPHDALVTERARHARVAQGHAESGYCCVRLRNDGQPIDVVMSMSPVRDDTGTVVGIASISRPVSDQEVSDSRFASLLEAAPDAMVCVDVRGRIAMVNAQVSALFGYDHDELIGAPLETLLPEELRQRHQGHRAAFFRHPTPRSMGAGLSLQGRRRDGSIFPVEVSLAADPGGGDLLAIAAVRDVTAQRATEAALRESETQLRQLAENVEIVFTLRQIEPPLNLYRSPAFHALTGWDEADILADPSLSLRLVHPEDRERFETTFFAPSEQGLAVSCEYRIIRRDGAVRWVRSFATPVPNPDGVVERIVNTTQDVTDRVVASQRLQEAEAAARTANDAKNEFLSRISHELRTPLNAVLGFGQLLEAELEETEHVESIHQVVRAGRHLLALINEVLDIARIEAGEMSLSPEPTEVAAIVTEALLLMQPLAAAAGVTLTDLGGPLGVYVLADRQRLRQILLNLLSNATKYNRAGGSVWVSWSCEPGERPSITVNDDGPGIAPALHSRLFTPFDRLGAEATGVDGTGVGLTVTRGLVQLMAGELTFASQVGHGASFTVTLPSSHEPVAPARDRTADLIAHVPMTSTSSSTAVVLYVEDNEPNVQVMEALLKLRPEWRLIHAALARLGIELARAHRPDLILLDVHLPDGSGLDVLQALKADAATTDLAVVVLSADASHTQIERLLAAGAARYLTKPLDIAEVLELLDGFHATARRNDRPATRGLSG